MATDRTPESPSGLLPQDEFSLLLRQCRDNPGAIVTQSRVDRQDFYGRSETWTIDTFRAEGSQTSFVQRTAAEGSLRLVLPPEVMAALTRQQRAATARSRSLRARRAVETRKARGDTLGNPAALRKARRARKAR